MNKKKLWGILACVLVVGAIGGIGCGLMLNEGHAFAGSNPASITAGVGKPPLVGQDSMSPASAMAASSPAKQAQESRLMPSPLDSTTYAEFSADAHGKLRVDASVADNLERLIALNDRSAALIKLRFMAQALPATAGHELFDLFNRYTQYALALSQASTSSDEPQTDAEAIGRLDKLHALRVQHLGAESARAMFGQDEEAVRQMLDLMRKQDYPSLTLGQKAELAQQALSQ